MRCRFMPAHVPAPPELAANSVAGREFFSRLRPGPHHPAAGLGSLTSGPTHLRMQDSANAAVRTAGAARSVRIRFDQSDRGRSPPAGACRRRGRDSLRRPHRYRTPRDELSGKRLERCGVGSVQPRRKDTGRWCQGTLGSAPVAGDDRHGAAVEPSGDRQGREPPGRLPSTARGSSASAVLTAPARTRTVPIASAGPRKRTSPN